MMRTTSRIFAMAALLIVVASAAASACTFTFSHAEIEAPLGTVGEIGVRVQKTHNRCTLPDMDSYEFTWSRIQVLDQTGWENLGGELYEIWFLVSLSEVGEGGLTISKDCSKEGYEEATLPIRVTSGTPGSSWASALAGTYPFESPDRFALVSLDGAAQVENGSLLIDEESFELPLGSGLGAQAELGPATLFYTSENRGPILLVTESLFVRLDSFLPPDA